MEKYNVKFKKKYGQNFLKNENTVKKIVDCANLDDKSLVIEVGPGGAIMTRELASRASQVIAYEIDTDLKEELTNKLSAFDNIDLIFNDFLTSDIDTDINKYEYDKLFFISNVPYYITTPILMKLLKSNLKFDKIIMMVQKEVGDRFSTLPGNKEYGSITVLLNYFYNVKKEFFVSRKQFIPEPNVDSVIISFTEKEDRLFLKDFDFFQQLLLDSFQFKRKTIRNNLKKYDLDKVEYILNKHGFDLNVRAEQLNVEIFVDIANYICE